VAAVATRFEPGFGLFGLGSGLSPTGPTGGTGPQGRSTADAVEWGRALGASPAEEVHEELVVVGNRLADALSLLVDLVREVHEFPDGTVAFELCTAVGHVEQAGADLADTARMIGAVS
jgi:hypothetical protein